jgi:Tol biopolymer transport system component
MRRRTFALATLCIAILGSTLPPASAAFPGDNGLIAFNRNDQIFVVEKDGSGEKQLTDGGVNKSPAWSADGKRLAWACDDDICVANADGSGRETLFSSADDEQQPEWSPDGEWIVFSRQPFEADIINISDPRIYKVEIDDPSNEVQLTDFDSADPEWSPNGKRILFTRGEFHGHEGVWSMRPNGRGIRKVSTRYNQNATPDWSPDGKRIVFLGKKRNRWRVVIATVRGKLIHEFERTRCCGLGVAWSPDGQRLVYVRSSHRRLVIARPRGADKTVVSEDARSPDWQAL